MSFSALSDLVTDLVPDTGARLTAGAMGRALEAARVHELKADLLSKGKLWGVTLDKAIAELVAPTH